LNCNLNWKTTKQQRMKDLFSGHSSDYARFRPSYPKEAIEYIISKVRNRGSAWDCGTGSGQLAILLADFFDRVHATDISAKQIENAPRPANVTYSVAAAEAPVFPRHCFDLITVGQAIHWFDFEKFYEVVRYTLKPGGAIAILGYGLLSVGQAVDQVISRLYTDLLGRYWDSERKYLDENYETIPFPFEEIESTHSFAQRVEWTFDQFTGYLNTWSAVKHFERATGKNPVAELADQFKHSWGTNTTRCVTFPTLIRIGRCV
jgi:SAM-dependent methyltransferase